MKAVPKGTHKHPKRGPLDMNWTLFRNPVLQVFDPIGSKSCHVENGMQGVFHQWDCGDMGGGDSLVVGVFAGGGADGTVSNS